MIYRLVNSEGRNVTIKPFYDYEQGPEITVTPENQNEWIILRNIVCEPVAPEEILYYIRKSEVSVLELLNVSTGPGHALIRVGQDSVFFPKDQFEHTKQLMLDYTNENHIPSSTFVFEKTHYNDA